MRTRSGRIEEPEKEKRKEDCEREEERNGKVVEE